MTDYRHEPTQELRDLADLEVLGLLDEIDQHKFEVAFDQATIVEQDAIRERQAALVQRLIGDPDGCLPEELKARVCAAVRDEIDLHDETLAPIAKIGRRRRERVQASESVAVPDEDHQSSTVFEYAKVRRSAALWRAASFALTASLVAAVFFVFHAEESAEEAARYASQRAGHEELLSIFGHDLDDILREDNSEEVLGLATSVGQRGVVGAILNKDTNSVKLLTFGLAPGEYTIRYQTEDQVPVSVAFEVTGQMGSTVVDLASADHPGGFAQDLLSRKWRIENAAGNIVAVCNPSVA